MLGSAKTNLPLRIWPAEWKAPAPLDWIERVFRRYVNVVEHLAFFCNLFFAIEHVYLIKNYFTAQTICSTDARWHLVWCCRRPSLVPNRWNEKWYKPVRPTLFGLCGDVIHEQPLHALTWTSSHSSCRGLRFLPNGLPRCVFSCHYALPLFRKHCKHK